MKFIENIDNVKKNYRIYRKQLLKFIVVEYTNGTSDGEVSSDSGALGNVEHPFIAIVPRSTLARNV